MNNDQLDALPELPEPDYWSTRDDDTPLYTADQMRARDAMWAERLTALQPQPAAAGVSDAVERVLSLAHAYADAKLMRYGQLGIKDLPDPQVAYEDLERAILALRPQEVPMAGRQARLLSREELADCCGGCASNSAIETWMRRAIAKFCEANGITAQGAQGGEAAK